ncbi:MAG: flagellar hook-associated protein 3 [Planctomycetota bacterium]|nr:MAG: flagellar hook-associated protein 3 [Planctomycetota bacterium]
MRVSEQVRVGSGLSDLRNVERSLARLEEQVSTGQRIVRPSDDPGGAARVARLETMLRRVDTAERVAAGVRSDLEAEDAALQQLSSLLARARELGVQGASEALSATDRAALASEVDSLLGQALDLGNTRVDGRYLFAGTTTETKPFALEDVGGVTTPTYQGSDVSREVLLGPGQSIEHAAGPEPFAGGGGALDALVALRDALRADDTAAVGAGVEALDTALDRTTLALGTVGARMSELDAAADGFASEKVRIQGLLGELRDVDLSEAIVDLKAQQTAYERGLQVVAGVLKVSILDFVGRL